MDNHTRKLLGLTDKHLFFDEEWLIEKNIKAFKRSLLKGDWMTHLPIVNTVDRFVLSATVPIYDTYSDIESQRKVDYFRIKTYPFSML
jgi:hypothetical protein